MRIEISEENRIVLEELVKEIQIIKHKMLKLSYLFVLDLKRIIITSLLGFKEYSPRNLKVNGIGNVLFARAVRFFKLEKEYADEIKNKIKSLVKKTKGIKSKKGYSIAKKIILFPLFLIYYLMKKYRLNRFKKPDKNVTNIYRRKKINRE